MKPQEELNFNRIAEAIDFLRKNFKSQPSLETVAERVHVSPYHFQRLFTEWAGTSPKKFLQYLTVEHAKQMLSEKQASLFDATHETGLSGTSRLHDLFVNIEGMTPAEYKNGGKALTIHYSFAESPFGPVMVASTSKGVCSLTFADSEEAGLLDLREKFPQANYQRKLDLHQQRTLFIFQTDWSKLSEIKLHLKGTDFQLKVWEALLKIPMGRLCTYGTIAQEIAQPKASRAVGTAIGSNPVAYLIPCHRVIQSTGILGGYMWGPSRKAAIIGWEAAKTTHE